MNMLPILLIIMASLQPSEIYPGENLTLTIDEEGTYFLQLSDNCTYFKDSGTVNLTAVNGSYVIETTFSCQPGYKYVIIKSDGKESKLAFKVLEPSTDYLWRSAIRLENENRVLKKEIDNLTAKIAELNLTISNLTATIENLNSSIEEYKEEVAKLQSELNETIQERDYLLSKVDELNKTIAILNQENAMLAAKLEEKTNIIGRLTSELTRSKDLINAFELMFLFVLSMLIGSYASLMRR